MELDLENIEHAGWKLWKWTGFKERYCIRIRQHDPTDSADKCNICLEPILKGDEVSIAQNRNDTHTRCEFPEGVPEQTFVGQLLWSKNINGDMKYLGFNVPLGGFSAPYQRGENFPDFEYPARKVTISTSPEDRKVFIVESLSHAKSYIDGLEQGLKGLP